MSVRLTYDDFDNLVSGLIEELSNVSLDAIVSINRDGLFVGVSLSHAFAVPHGVVSVSHYDGTGERGTLVWDGKLVEHLDEDNTVLLTDDVVGTGKTMNVAKNRLEEEFTTVITSSLLKAEGLGGSVDYFVSSTDEKIIFPWQSIS